MTAIVPAGRAQGALNPPVPLSTPNAAPSVGGVAMTLAAAQRAQDLGLPSLAVDLYKSAQAVAGAEREAVTLALVTALLDAGRAAEAETVLAAMPEPRSAAWHLRAGLAAVQLNQGDAARAAFAAIRERELPVADHPWWWFFQGELVDLAPVRELSRANDFYLRAETGAPTELARARFQLAAERHRLRLSRPTEADARLARENYERHQGTQLGYEFAESHAAILDTLGQKPAAVTFLQGVLLRVPRQERGWWDKLRLVLGIIGDKSRNGAGRTALAQLVENGSSAERQRQALQMLAAASTGDAERRHFRELLKRLIDGKPDHPIKEALLFFRAQLALTEKDFAVAEEDSAALLKQFPLSPLRAHVFGLLAQSAWEQRRFRQAAEWVRKTRAELVGKPPVTLPGEPAAPRPVATLDNARVRADLGVLEAEAWFRAGLAAGDRNDFRAAADAYAAVLRERPPGLGDQRLGPLMFQRILAEIRSESGQAAKIMDELERDPAFDLEHRWQAEWSLARALQLKGDAGIRAAYARVNELLATPAPGASTLKPELRARMAWLRAQLAFESGEANQAITFSEELLKNPPAVEAPLRREIESMLLLVKASAEFALGREPSALETLRMLRDQYADTDAAISSYLIESEHYAAQDKIDEARNRLISLTDNKNYRNSPNIPYALFRLALLSERLGREENLEEANKRIEELVNHPAAIAQPDWIFAARMKQGDIFRKRNDFPAAQRAYEELINKYSRRPDIVLAQLALAKTLNAQSAGSESTHADAAQLMFEQLRDRVDAPLDVRVEAGYNHGAVLVRRGRNVEAAQVWWRDVIQPFLIDARTPIENGAKRPYWLARTLRELGDLQEKLGRLEDAKATYRLLLDTRLPYGEFARSRLEQLGVPLVQP